MDFKEFMLENALPIETKSYVASPRFKAEDGKAAAWQIKAITTEQDEELRNAAKKRRTIPGTRETKIEIDYDAYVASLVCACVTHPNLNDAALQNSYNAVGAEDLIRKMLTPGEYTDLVLAVQENNGFQSGMDEKIKKVKN